jgi:voltage-gated potassium channel
MDSQRLARLFEWPVLIAALLVVPILVVQESSLDEPWDTVAHLANWGSWLTFTAEMTAMLVVTRDRWGWLRESPLTVAVVLFTPPFLPALLQGARVLRLLTLLRLVALAPLAKHLFSLEGLRYVALLAVLTALGGGAAYAALEDHATAWDGFWWAVVTMATVGYGDTVPQSDGGRILAIGVMLVGIGFMATLTAALAQRFLASSVREVEQSMEELDVEEAQLLDEIRMLGRRLDRIERALERLDSRRSRRPDPMRKGAR